MFEKNPALSDVSNNFALMGTCDKDVNKVEKSKVDIWEPWKFRIRNFSMTSEEYLIDQK